MSFSKRIRNIRKVNSGEKIKDFNKKYTGKIHIGNNTKFISIKLLSIIFSFFEW